METEEPEAKINTEQAVRRQALSQALYAGGGQRAASGGHVDVHKKISMSSGSVDTVEYRLPKGGQRLDCDDNLVRRFFDEFG